MVVSVEHIYAYTCYAFLGRHLGGLIGHLHGNSAYKGPVLLSQTTTSPPFYMIMSLVGEVTLVYQARFLLCFMCNGTGR